LDAIYFTVVGWQWDELYENTVDRSSPHPRPEGTNIDGFSSGGFKPNRVPYPFGLAMIRNKSLSDRELRRDGTMRVVTV
jgi:hypothetical protein